MENQAITEQEYHNPIYSQAVIDQIHKKHKEELEKAVKEERVKIRQDIENALLSGDMKLSEGAKELIKQLQALTTKTDKQ